MLQETRVDLEIWNIKRGNKATDLVQEFYNYPEGKYGDCVYMMDPKRQITGAAMVVPSQQITKSKRTSDHLSIYAVELCAIAIEWVEDKTDRKIAICSDSFSALLSIKTGQRKHIRKYYMKYC